MEYRRLLSAEAFNYLQNEGSFIIHEIRAARTDEPFSLDIQIRRNNEVMVYMGNTCILKIRVRTQIERLEFSAHEAYFTDFLSIYPFNEVPKYGIRDYLIGTIPNVGRQWYNNHKEGYYQNMLCYHYGEIANNDSPFIIFDRESVPGFINNEERNTIFNPIENRYQNIRRGLQEANQERFGQPNDAALGTGLDFLAIDKQCNLICIELKHGNNNLGICWGGLQLAVYHELFNELNKINPKTLFSNIKELIEQKVKLDLLPAEVSDYFTNRETFNSIKSCLVVAEPNFKMNCWSKMIDVINEIPIEFQCEVFTIDTKSTPPLSLVAPPTPMWHQT